ncbi:hypothetical protein DIPPA_24848 [Diplonema papillatum]|nr:hypothetical protein DIPPA_24848 [Diplonema papillatum]
MLTRLTDVRRDGADQRYSAKLAKQTYEVKYECDTAYVLPYNPRPRESVMAKVASPAEAPRVWDYHKPSNPSHSGDSGFIASSTDSAFWEDMSDDELPPDSMFFHPIDVCVPLRGK